MIAMSFPTSLDAEPSGTKLEPRQRCCDVTSRDVVPTPAMWIQGSIMCFVTTIDVQPNEIKL